MKDVIPLALWGNDLISFSRCQLQVTHVGARSAVCCVLRRRRQEIRSQPCGPGRSGEGPCRARKAHSDRRRQPWLWLESVVRRNYSGWNQFTLSSRSVSVTELV